MDELAEQFKGDEGTPAIAEETKVETKPEEKPAEETKPEETKPEETKPADEPKPDETKPEETKAEDKPAEETKAKPDLSTLSKEEKAEHAFKRQLSKQKEKHEAEIKDLKDSFQKQLDDFKAEVKKSTQPKEEPKMRKDFNNDDEYIKYLTQQGVDARMAELDEKNAKDRAEKEAKAKEEQEYAEQQKQLADTFQRNCKAAFQDEQQYGEFAQKVNKGIANGLGELLDQAPAIRDYLFYNQDGPIVLNEMLSNKDSFVRVMQNAGNPMMAAIEMHDLARELKTKAVTPVETQPVETPKQMMPKLGKPGAKSGGARTSIFSSDKDLIKFIRSR